MPSIISVQLRTEPSLEFKRLNFDLGESVGGGSGCHTPFGKKKLHPERSNFFTSLGQLNNTGAGSHESGAGLVNDVPAQSTAVQVTELQGVQLLSQCKLQLEPARGPCPGSVPVTFVSVTG